MSAMNGVVVESIVKIEWCNGVEKSRLRYIKQRRRGGVSKINSISGELLANCETGLRCPQRIPKGTFIDTYPGELLTLAEAIKRADKYTESGSGQSYLFDLDKFSKVRQRADNRGGDSDDEDESQSVSPMVQPEEIYVVDGKNYGGVTR